LEQPPNGSRQPPTAAARAFRAAAVGRLHAVLAANVSMKLEDITFSQLGGILKVV
jgi:hypothetical protein